MAEDSDDGKVEEEGVKDETKQVKKVKKDGKLKKKKKDKKSEAHEVNDVEGDDHMQTQSASNGQHGSETNGHTNSQNSEKTSVGIKEDTRQASTCSQQSLPSTNGDGSATQPDPNGQAADDNTASSRSRIQGIFVDPLMAVTSKTKDLVQEAALKPMKNVAIKVKDDVEFMVRDPKEFAKQKKCEVEDMMFPAVPDVDDPEWQAQLAKQRTVHLKDFPRFMFVMVVLRATYLNLIGGFVNAVALAGLWGMGITHLSGITTMAGVRIVNPPLPNAQGTAALSCWWFFAMLIAFCLGSVLGGIITGDARYRWQGRQALTLLFEALFLGAAYLCARAGPIAAAAGDAGAGFRVRWWGAVFVCLASGTQNSLTSNYTAIVVRSTHTTGLVVDIGMAIGQMINTRSYKYMWKLQVWVPVLMGFMGGALLGAAAFAAADAEALLVAVVLVLILSGGTWLDMAYKELRRADRVVFGVRLPAKVTKDFKEF